jgi:hypothetical protein
MFNRRLNKSNKRLPANVENDHYPLVDNLLKMEKSLRSRSCSGLNLQVEVIEDEITIVYFPVCYPAG